jgi:hypothetical protein
MMWDSEQLWLKAKAYAQRAHNVEHSNPDFPLWCALSMELLARAALTRIHPVLNADPREDINLLYACGFEVAGQPRSLPIHSVLRRLEKTVPLFGKSQREVCDFLSLLRNQELHSAEQPFENLRESKWLPRFYEACKILCESMGKSLADFLGDEDASSAERLISGLEREIESSVRSRLAAHAKVFNEKPEEARQQLKVEAAGAVMRLPLGRAKERCPACGVEGVVSGDLIKELPAVYADDQLLIDQEYIATAFECLACGLVLRSIEEVRSAGLEPRFSAQTATSLHELYEPEYYDEYDNM